MTKIADIRLSMNLDVDLADGTYYGVALWDRKARDYLDVPGLYAQQSDARDAGRAVVSVGSRPVRWTVFRKSVTTRKALT